MKLISTVTHHGEREAVLAVLEDGSSFLAPVFDGKGELIAYHEGEMEQLGELVREFVTGIAQRESGPGETTGVPDGSMLLSAKAPCPDCHTPAQINRSKPGGPNGIPEELLSILRELARASISTRNLVIKLATNLVAHDALESASASSREKMAEMEARPA